MVLRFPAKWLSPVGLALLSLLLLLPRAVVAEIYVGEGQAFVVAGNLAQARQLAYEMALQQAVQKALEARLAGDPQAISEAQLRIQELTTSAAELASSQKVIDEQRQGNLLQLSVALDLASSAINQVLDANRIGSRSSRETSAAAHPSVMVVLQEELSGRRNPEPYALSPVLDELRAQGYRLVDPVAMTNSLAHDRAVQSVLRGDIKAAQAAALQFGAAMIITGTGSAQASGMQGGGMQVYGATLTLRAYQADSAALLASSSADGSYPHINPASGQKNALEEAAKKAAKTLVRQLEKAYRQTGDTIAVSVSDISYYQLSILKKILQRDFPEILSLNQRGFAGDVARLDIRVPDPQAFTDRVVQRDFGSFRLDVVSYSPHKVDFVLMQIRN